MRNVFLEMVTCSMLSVGDVVSAGLFLTCHSATIFCSLHSQANSDTFRLSSTLRFQAGFRGCCPGPYDALIFGNISIKKKTLIPRNTPSRGCINFHEKWNPLRNGGGVMFTTNGGAMLEVMTQWHTLCMGGGEVLVSNTHASFHQEIG